MPKSFENVGVSERWHLETDWPLRIGMAQVLATEFLKNEWGACDLTRTSLWIKTGNSDRPFIYVGIHGFFCT